MKNGNIGKYESVLEEILNNLVFFGEKFNTFQREIDLLSSEKK